MKVYKETIMAGRTILRSIKISSGDHRDKRAPKKNITPDAVRKNNDRLAVKNLTADLNANFKGGDMHITLTYAAVPTLRQAKRDREKFLRDLRKELRKQGIELKYIAVTGFFERSGVEELVSAALGCRKRNQDVWFFQSEELTDCVGTGS